MSLESKYRTDVGGDSLFVNMMAITVCNVFNTINFYRTAAICRYTSASIKHLTVLKCLKVG